MFPMNLRSAVRTIRLEHIYQHSCHGFRIKFRQKPLELRIDMQIVMSFGSVDYPGYEQYAGAVSGTEDGTFTDNYFVSDELAGLGRISYAGLAEPISYEAMCALEGIPDMLKDFTLTFLADGDILKEVSFSYGASFDSSIFPELPEKEGCYARWSTEALDDLRFDTVVEVIYIPYITTLAAPWQRENGRAVFYLEGYYRDGDVPAAESLSTCGVALEGIEIPFFRELTVNELWTLHIPEDGQETHALRFLPPEGSSGLRLYLRTADGWSRIETEEIGRYLAFHADGNELELAVCTVRVPEWLRYHAIRLLAVLLILAVCLWIRHRKKKRKKTLSET